VSVLDGLRALIGRRGVERDVQDELEAHVAHRVDELIAGGAAPDEAERRARAELGDAARFRAECTEIRSRAHRGTSVGARLDRLGHDLRFALRQLRRSVGFTLVATLTLTLGVGATVVIVSVVRAVVLRPLPFADPGRVVVLEMLTPDGGEFSVAEPAFLEWRERASSLESIAALAGRGATLREPGEPTPIRRGYASAGLFRLLGVDPAPGREFTPDEDEPGSPAAVALLGHALWVERFEASPDALGRTLDLDGQRYLVVGVVPKELDLLLGGYEVITPLGASMAADRGEHYLDVLARVRPDVTLERARADLRAVAAWQSATHPEDDGWSARLESARDVFVGDATERAGWVLLAAAALLLAMACVNVSNLLLARATVRRGEMGVRAALGAGRGRILGQLFTESAVLAGLGGAFGLGLAWLALPVVRGLGAGRIPRLQEATLDPWSVAVALLAVAIATLVFGSAPAFAHRGDDPARGLRSAGRGAGNAGGKARRILVAMQMAASVVLLLGTGLLLRSFVRLARVDVGFEPEGALAVGLTMPDASWGWAERGPLVQSILEAVEAVPGVERAGATAVRPFSGMALGNFIAREDRTPARASEFTPIQWRAVTPGFFEAMGMDLRAGRTLRPSDDWEGGTPVVISESLVRVLWEPGEEVVGQRLVWGDPDGSRLTVVGVVGELRDVSLGDEPMPMVYRPHRQIPWAAMTLVVRTRPGATDVAASLPRAIQAAAPGIAVPEVQPLATHVRQALAEPRFNVLLLASFAGVGLALAVVGLYGLTAFEVRRRFREIGIRVSLGADPARMSGMLVRDGMALAALGLAAGLVLTGWLSRWLESLLFQTSTRDPLTWIVVVGTLMATAALAAWIPARRATRVDPREVLTTE
jgi:predicted permease